METQNNRQPSSGARRPATGRKKNAVKIHRTRKVKAIFISVVLVSIILAVPFVRSKTSQSEKRDLAEFPKLTWSGLWDGSFYDGVSTWYSDTVPARDFLTSLNFKFQNLLGIANTQKEFSEQTANEAETKDVISYTPEEISSMQAEKESREEASSTEAGESTTAAPKYEDDEFSGNLEKLGAIVIVDNAGYEYYNYVESTAEKYAKAVNYAATLLNGKTKVHCMIVPLSSDVTMNTKAREKLNGMVSDQENAINSMFSSMSSDVDKVDILPILRAHRSEYVYFRTDHHWTGLGAYYAYTEYCAKAGLTALPLEKFTLKSFEGFLGTFYNDSGQDPRLSATPDRVDTYTPPGDISMTVTDSSGTYSMPVIYDETNASAGNKYGAFISGDNAYSVITNNSSTSNDVLVLVKESFGNAIAPLMPAHYKTVYVIDYRYWSGSITDFCVQVGAKDLLFCNNISATRSAALVDNLSAKIG